MRLLALIAFAWSAATCAPYSGQIRSDHAREFGCQERWVQVDEVSPDRWRATGCGFRSDWACAERVCRMRDHGSYGVDSP